MGYGVATREQVAGLSGLEVRRKRMAGELPAAPIAEPLGFRLAEVERGLAIFEGTPGPHLLNPLGSIHGGYALTLIDSACGCAGAGAGAAGAGACAMIASASACVTMPSWSASAPSKSAIVLASASARETLPS